MATVVPEGSVWSVEMKMFSDGVERETNGRVKLRWYWGGIAGDEQVAAKRVEKGQFDGMAASVYCWDISKSMRVLSIPGVFQSRDEASYILQQLRPTIEKEMREIGYTLLGTPDMGPSVMFSRVPVRNMNELRQYRWWRWDLDQSGMMMSREMGLDVQPTPIYDAMSAFEANRFDGFIAIPAAALAFQWSARARYLIDLKTGYLSACILLANRAFERLSIQDRETIRSLAAKGELRIEDRLRKMDEELLGGLFQKQGLVAVPVSPSFRAQFFEAARSARERLGEKLASSSLLDRVLRLLADYRAEHGVTR
jgi:TRAP-type C4-dicarboxylate transport system substrate-binding protein